MNISILLLNCRSIKNKRDEFSALVETVKPSVILGTESWLDPDIGDHEVFPTGYTCYRKDRNGHGGGVFILIDSSIRSSQIDVDAGVSEVVLCKLELPNRIALTVCSFYRPPNASPDVLTRLQSAIDEVHSDTVVIGGDFNLPDLKWDASNTATVTGICNTEMMNMVNLHALHQLVLTPTRGNNILDLLLTNRPELVQSTLVIPGISDHHAVVSTMSLAYVKTKNHANRKLYNYKKANFDCINQALQAYLVVFETEAECRSVDGLWRLFKQKILELRELFVPTWVLTARQGRSKPWFTKTLRQLTQKRQRTYRAYCRKPSKETEKKLKEITREVKEATRIAKDSYSGTIQTRLKDKPKVFWKHVKQNGKDVVTIPPLVSGDVIVREDADKAECFNAYFCSVFTPAVMPSEDVPPVLETISDMDDVVICTHGIESLLRRLDSSKACGPDDLPNFLLKSCAESIAKYLKVIFDMSLLEASLPDDWKAGIVVPIHKSGPRSDVSNYRPISLTSVACKIMEHILFTSIVAHLNTHSAITSAQHGFRKGFSCVTQLLEFTNDIASALDKRLAVECIFLDFRKAFDTVPHSLLIEKMLTYKINPAVVSWIKEYLTLRRQFVVVNGVRSRAQSVSSGVPQGSVLGPLLFLLYINDIGDGLTSQLRLFADDCVVYRITNGTEDLNLIQQDLDRISTWCTRWRMQLNLTKTVNMTFTRKKNPLNYCYTLNNIVIGKVTEFKYLGVWYTPELSWQKQVNYVTGKAGKMLGFIRRNSGAFSQSTRELLYKTYVRSVLEYACVVWDPTTARDVIKLERVQNLGARYVSRQYTINFSATRTKEELKWDTLVERRRKLRLKLFHSIYYGAINIQRDIYIIPPNYRSQRVDHERKVREVLCRTELFKKSFFPKTIHDWNRLPADIVNVVSNEMFFALLK